MVVVMVVVVVVVMVAAAAAAAAVAVVVVQEEEEKENTLNALLVFGMYRLINHKIVAYDMDTTNCVTLYNICGNTLRPVHSCTKNQNYN